jgi:hypothetical protein
MFTSSLQRFQADDRASITVIVAITLVALALAFGAAIDYARVARARIQSQTAMDAAVLAALKENYDFIVSEAGITVSDYAKSKVDEAIKRIFDSSSPISSSQGTIETVITKNTDGSVNVRSLFHSSMKTLVTKIAGISFMPYTVMAQASFGGSRKYADYIFIVDGSGSMSIGSTQQMMDAMEASPLQCSFACHLSGGYETARNLGFETKFDVVKSGLSGIMQNFAGANKNGTFVSVGAQVFSNRIGNEQYNKGSFENTTDMSLAKSKVDAMTMHEVNGGTNFRESLRNIPDWIGKSGDGSAANKAQKIVVLVTDGVADDVWFTGPPKSYPDAWWPSKDWNWVPETTYVKVYPPYSDGAPTANGWFEGFSPFNSNYYNKFKQNNVTVYVIQASYFIPTTKMDKRYNAIRDFILTEATAQLKACASDPTKYFKADDRDSIISAFRQVAQAESGKLRLSQ